MAAKDGKMEVTHAVPRHVQGHVAVQLRPIRVLLVEDSHVLTDRLKELLDGVPGVELVGTVEREQEAVDLLQRIGVDAIVLDLQLKSGTGFGVLRKIAPLSPRPVVIVYTNYDLPEYRREASLLGASYFLDKSRDYDRLRDIIGAIGNLPPD